MVKPLSMSLLKIEADEIDDSLYGPFKTEDYEFVLYSDGTVEFSNPKLDMFIVLTQKQFEQALEFYSANTQEEQEVEEETPTNASDIRTTTQRKVPA